MIKTDEGSETTTLDRHDATEPADTLELMYRLGRHDGYQLVAARLARALYERDLWYFVASNPGKTPADFHLRHTDYLRAEAMT